MRRLCWLFACALAFLSIPAAFAETLGPDGYPDVDVFEVVVKGLGKFDVMTEGGLGRYPFSIGYFRGGIQRDEHEIVQYAERGRRTKAGTLPPTTPYENCVVELSCRPISFVRKVYLLPNFDMSRGLYYHRDVERLMPKWRSLYKLGPEHEYTFQFIPDEVRNRTLVYLEGSLLLVLNDVSQVNDVLLPNSKGNALEIVSKNIIPVRNSSIEELQSLPHRANPLLKEGARLSIEPGRQIIEGIPMTVWPPEMSIDQGEHYQTTMNRDLGWNPMMFDRNPWSVGTEYMMWRVPNFPWRYAYILCADIPQANKEPMVGTQFLLIGNQCTSGNTDFVRTSLAEAGSNPNIKIVGALTYQQDGKTIETPLYLVRQLLNYSKIGDRTQKTDVLDFELVGGGTSGSYKRSSVQVFGVSLRSAPYTFVINNPVNGNIFEQGSEPFKTGFDLTPTDDEVSGSYSYKIYDPYFHVLKEGGESFSLAKNGQAYHHELDLSEFPVGWYGLDYEFRDAQNRIVTTHSAAFTVLAKDDRQAGYESPYAAWPHLKGLHGNNPNNTEIMDMMRKAGYRKTWHIPAENEEAASPWKITCSELAEKCNPPWPPIESREKFDEFMDKTVEIYKAQKAKFPHCQVIQLLHEQGGRGMAKEVAGTIEPVRGVYRGWDFGQPDLKDRGRWEAFYCTEYAKRMKKEFPDMRIMLGNGSSSSEKVAITVRNGFDLNLVDQLGIESKGFGTMPEFNGNREAPGMFWALRETGRVFGYDHLTLNACNEYVFRPERMVQPDWPLWKIMRVTDYTLRDYLLSLANGCDIISTGHLEDSVGTYYDTNWGAGGQCKFYPYSYPKRMYTALAVLTRVLDKPIYSRRLETGEITAYAQEFKRDRDVKDFAYALWTPHFGETLAIQFPKGTALTQVDVFGQEKTLSADGTGAIAVEIGSTPTYVIASQAALSARVVAHAPWDIPDGCGFIDLPELGEMSFPPPPENGFNAGSGWEVPNGLPGKFVLKKVYDDDLRRDVLEAELVREGDIPAVRFEAMRVNFTKPIKVHLGNNRNFGILVKGNSGFGQVKLILRRQFKGDEILKGPWWLNGKTPEMKAKVFKSKGDEFEGWMGPTRSYVSFEGWQAMMLALDDGDFDPWRLEGADEVEVVGMIFGTSRKSLDPIEMAEVTKELRFGPIVQTPPVMPKDEDMQKKLEREAMSTVDDKDW